MRALHFLCTIRCDREDVQGRLANSYRDWTQDEIRRLAFAHQEALRTKQVRRARAGDIVFDGGVTILPYRLS